MKVQPKVSSDVKPILPVKTEPTGSVAPAKPEAAQGSAQTIRLDNGAPTAVGRSLKRELGSHAAGGGVGHSPAEASAAGGAKGADAAYDLEAASGGGFRAPNVVLRQGSGGEHVKTLQRRLKEVGFDPGSADGDFGPKTAAAVKAFQRSKGLGADGVVGPQTWKALEGVQGPSAPSPAPSTSRPTLREGAKGEDVKALQQRLKSLGFDPGAADGDFGGRTSSAVRSFQHAAGLGADGVVGPRTWAALDKGGVKPPADIPGLGPVTTTTGYVNGRARTIQVARVDGKPVEVDTAKAYLRMKQDAARDGVNIQLISGFRTMAEQQRLWDGWNRRLPGFNPAARPGYSNHQSGVALDLNTQGSSISQGSGAVYNWLARNAHKYGFKRIPSEHWHWEYQPGLQKYR